MFSHLFFRMKNSIWLMPALITLGSFLLAISVVFIENNFFHTGRSFLPDVFLVGADLAQTILGTIAGSLLTMTTITFSTIMVVLTTYSSQFSPRTLQNFIRDTVTMRVLGVFIGGFVYAISSLLFMQEGSNENHIAVVGIGVIVAFVCLAFFAYFINHVAVSIQVSKLIERLSNDVLGTINETIKKVDNNSHIHILQVPPDVSYQFSEKTEICSTKFGYVQFIYLDQLYKRASEQGYYIEIQKQIGDFLHDNKSVMSISHNEPLKINLNDEVTIGNDRTTIQDVDFGLQKLAEVALRAISPGINDPNTAIECIRHLGLCLKAASNLDGFYLVYYDDNDRVVLSIPQRPFEEMLRSAFYQISHYGQSDISILIAVFDALYAIAEDQSKSIKEKIVQFSDYLMEKVDCDSLAELDRVLMESRKRSLDKLVESHS